MGERRWRLFVLSLGRICCPSHSPGKSEAGWRSLLVSVLEPFLPDYDDSKEGDYQDSADDPNCYGVSLDPIHDSWHSRNNER